MSFPGGTEYVFEHLFKGKNQSDVYKGVLEWLRGEDAKVTISDGASTIIATMGGRRIFGSEHPFSQKGIMIVLATTGGDVLATATMTHARHNYDSQSKRVRVKAGWGYLANQLWASIEGGELAEKYLHPIDQQRKELETTEGMVKRKIAIWSVVEIILAVAGVYLGDYASGDVFSAAAGMLWLAVLFAFAVLLLPLVIWLGVLTNVRYSLKRIKWREDLGLKY